MFQSNDSVDYTKSQLFKEFEIPYPLQSISALPKDEVAYLDEKRDAIHLYDYVKNHKRILSFNFVLSSLAVSADIDNKLVFATSNNIHIQSPLDIYNGFRYVTYQNSLPSIISLLVGNKQIITQTPGSIVVLDNSEGADTWRVLKPHMLINNLDHNYVLAALSDNLLVIGSRKTIYILDSSTGKIVRSFNVHGNIQALTRLDNNHCAVGFVECEFRGNVPRIMSCSDLQAAATDNFVPTSHHKFMSVVCIYNLSESKKVAELNWKNSNRIKFLAAPLSGARLIVGFEEYLTMPRYAELLSGGSAAGDLLQYHPQTTQNNTHFEVYKFAL